MATKKRIRVKREPVVKLFELLGYKTAPKWDNKKLQGKIKNLPELTDGVKIKNTKAKHFLAKLLAAKKVVVGEKEKEPKAPKEKAQKSDSKKKTQKPKAAKRTGPGVIASIQEYITNHGPISKPQILAKLKQRFPDRDAEAMTKTVNVQLPGRMSKEKKIKIVKDDKGRFSIKK